MRKHYYHNISKNLINTRKLHLNLSHIFTNPKQNMQDTKKIIDSIVTEVKKRLENEGSGHDWFHVERVWKMAKRIGKLEKANMFVVECAALLHDIADWKMHGGDDTVGPRVARKVLEDLHVEEEIISHVCDIVANLSFKGAKVKFEMKTLEG